MDDQQPTPTAQTPIYQESQQKNAKWLWLLIILIIAGALVFAYVRGLGPFAQFRLGQTEEAVESPSPAAFFSSPSPEASPASALERSEPKVRVLNGSGRAGAASAIRDFLEGKGYQVASIGNAANYNFEQTVLRFKESFKQFEELLIGDLSDNYSVIVSSDNLEATDSADIEVIVGAK